MITQTFVSNNYLHIGLSFIDVPTPKDHPLPLLKLRKGNNSHILSCPWFTHSAQSLVDERPSARVTAR